MKFEAFTEGQTFTTKPVTITKEAIFDFAERNDPQYLHLDEEAANEGPFGGIIASGFHTLSVVWVQWIHMDIFGRDCLGGMGLNRLSWKAPVFPNDTVVGEFKVLRKRKLEGHRGVLTLGIRVNNQEGKEVLSCEVVAVMRSET
ncbi:acyl dehydratase [Pullulanibacillus pueri]|uniref:MaoC-like domain-containing protein n=1 Tax=Pullulanibacillus pueri TaxID=1437324 RepID=A0A8J2ZV82_9BACL|nr:MaoC/PaaZ C-terminal domain-containing protein [Pullulanibacillus pueri]MBM7681372.1 acyl dehydratase [Pullulanibacillus pueri]GGH78618.1 hypothetical protein GCM10007096_12320 [Pullulanibacillus pueri]